MAPPEGTRGDGGGDSVSPTAAAPPPTAVSPPGPQGALHGNAAEDLTVAGAAFWTVPPPFVVPGMPAFLPPPAPPPVGALPAILPVPSPTAPGMAFDFSAPGVAVSTTSSPTQGNEEGSPLSGAALGEVPKAGLVIGSSAVEEAAEVRVASKRSRPRTSAGAGPAVKKPKASTSDPSDPSGWDGRILEFEIPRRLAQRIASEAIGDPTTQFSKHVKSAFSRAAGVFAMYVTAAAQDVARSAKRQILTAADVVQAIHDIGYSDFLGDLQNTLDDHRVASRATKASGKASPAAKSAPAPTSPPQGSPPSPVMASSSPSPPPPSSTLASTPPCPPRSEESPPNPGTAVPSRPHAFPPTTADENGNSVPTPVPFTANADSSSLQSSKDGSQARAPPTESKELPPRSSLEDEDTPSSSSSSSSPGEPQPSPLPSQGRVVVMM